MKAKISTQISFQMSAQIISNRYQILQSLGEGGFGHTFLAVDLHLPTKPQCVVKKLQPQDTDSENLKLAGRLFEQEAEVQYRLGNHPNISTLLAHFEFEGEFYLVQELIVGETLAQEFASGRKYNEAEAVYLADQILDTLAFVHQQNIIHRDIKPSNLVRRGSDGKIFLIDFGAVKQVNFNPFKNAASFHSTIAIGSAGYMPSEQAAGKPCFASDLYGVGLVLIQALTTFHPLQLVQNRNTGEFVWQHKATNIRPEVASLIAKLVRYDYRQRWYSAKEAVSALNLIRTSLGYQKKVAPPRILQAVQIPVQNFPIRQQPQIIQPLQSQLTGANLNISSVTAPKLEPLPQMPTIVQFTKGGYPANYDQPQNNRFFNDIWDSNLKISLFILGISLGFIVFVSVLAFLSINSMKQTAENQRDAEYAGIPKGQNLAFDEALKLDEEAKELWKTATTPADWQGISKKYSNAVTLLESVEKTDLIYPYAVLKLKEFQFANEFALSKVSTGGNIGTTTPNVAKVSTSPITQPNSTPYYPTQTSYPTQNYPTQTTSTPAPVIKKAKMPGRRKEKMYIAFSSSGGEYIGGGKDKVFTYEDGNFSAEVNYHKGVSIRFDGGPDSWSIDFAAPQKMALTPGSYGGAQRFPFQSPTRPGLSFSGSGRGCSESLGSFTINNIIYSLDNKNIYLLDATFSQSCENSSPHLMGRIYYDVR